MIASKFVRSALLPWSVLGALAACSSDPAPPLTPKESATLGVKAYISSELTLLASASSRLHDAAPMPDDNGWNATDDRVAVDKLRTIWADTRDSYEKVEGAVAELFPDIDVTIDERYDGFIDQNGPDNNLFDDDNVTGMHAIERILWADSQPAHVVEFESALVGYKPAAFPTTRQEAQDFRDKLTARLAKETGTIRDAYASKNLALDPNSAFSGVVGSMREQFEKLNNAATAADESRYAQKTLEDMRANLAGGRAIYEEFQTWVKESANADVDSQVLAGFDRIDHAYAAIGGDALPDVPKTFDSTDPSKADLATPYGQLWQLLTDEGDGTRSGSLVKSMIDAASAMGIPFVICGLSRVALAAAIAFGLCGCLDDGSMDDVGAMDADGQFIALSKDFCGFRDWMTFPLRGVDMHAGLSGTVVAYLKQLPKAGATEFPMGEMVVKTVEVGAESEWEVHAMVKRGGTFNARGAIGWEFFDLSLLGDCAPRIDWRGEHAPRDHGYKSLPGLDNSASPTSADCNTCHGTPAALENDAILSVPLRLSDLSS